MKKIIMVIFSLVFLTGAVHAQSSSNYLWMVSSKSAMTSYAVSLIKRASVSVYSGGSVNEINCQTTAWAYNKSDDTLDVLNLLAGQQMTFSVARPSQDYVGLYSYVYGVNGDILFYGGNYGPLEKNSEGKFDLPAGMFYLNMNLGWDIPIYVPAAIQAKLIIRDENGNVVETRYLDFRNGYMMFRTEYLGYNADLATTYDCGGGNYVTTVTSVRSNQTTQAENLVINGPKLSIDGLWDFGGDMDYIDYLSIVPQSDKGHGQSPLVRFKTTYGKSVYLLAKTTEGEKPTGVWLKNTVTGEEKYYPYSGNVNQITINIPHAGIWEMIFEWSSFDDKIYQNPYWEKG